MNVNGSTEPTATASGEGTGTFGGFGNSNFVPNTAQPTYPNHQPTTYAQPFTPYSNFNNNPYFNPAHPSQAPVPEWNEY